MLIHPPLSISLKSAVVDLLPKESREQVTRAILRIHEVMLSEAAGCEGPGEIEVKMKLTIDAIVHRGILQVKHAGEEYLP